MSVLLMLQTSADRAVQPQEKPSFSGLWSRDGLKEWLCQGLEMMILSSSLMQLWQHIWSYGELKGLARQQMQYFKERNSLVWKLLTELLVGVVELWCCGCSAIVLCLRKPHWNNCISEKVKVWLGLKVVGQKDVFPIHFFTVVTKCPPGSCAWNPSQQKGV